MKKGAIAAVFLAVLVFGAALAIGIGVLALVGKVADGRQAAQVAQAQSEIAHEQRLQVEAQQAPELIEEEWQGQTQYLLVLGQLEGDRDMRQALIKLALADYSARERSQAFSYAVWTLALCFLAGVIWWLAATRAVQGGGQGGGQ